MDKRAIICLSSGLTPQYRLDILRCLALPSGMSIQFRYGQSLIAEDLREELAANQLAGSIVLLAYVDSTDAYKKEGVTCPVTPCRYATLENSSRIGSKFFLTFQLGAFAKSSPSSAVDEMLGNNSPKWTSGEKGLEVRGFSCFSITAKPSLPESSPEVETWEALIRQLATRSDFKEELLFFVIEGVYERSKSEDKRQDPIKGEYRFKSDKDYSLRVFHLHPKRDNVAMPKSIGMMNVRFGAPQLSAITASALPVDSPYDLKHFRFRSGAVTREEFSSIVVGIEARETGRQIESQPDIYLPVRCVPAIWKPVIKMFVLALLLWAQQFVPLASKGEVAPFTSVVMVILAILISGFLVFGLKKPL